MSPAEHVVQPGGWFFSQTPLTISTLLGSCVAVTVWHPGLHCGGMCHYLLPRKSSGFNETSIPNPRYGVDALELLFCKMSQEAPIKEYRAGIFGGATMFLGNQKVGESNGILAIRWIELHKLHVDYSDIGGVQGRKIKLDLNTGTVQTELMPSANLQGEGNGN